MTNRQQSAFFLAIVFLFTSGIGLVIYRQYDQYYQQKTAIDLEAASATQIPAWEVYSNPKYNITFGYPSYFQLEEDPMYKLPGESASSTADVPTITLKKGDRLGISLLTPRTGVGCGEGQEISNQNFKVNELVIKKDIFKNTDLSQKCFEYAEFNQDQQHLYFVAWMPLSDVGDEKVFDKIVSSFRFIK